MIVGDQGRESTLANALSSAGRFGLERDEAVTICESVLEVVREQWEALFALRGVPAREIGMLRGRAVLSPRAAEIE